MMKMVFPPESDNLNADGTHEVSVNGAPHAQYNRCLSLSLINHQMFFLRQ